jgi:acyl carrier protein
MTRDEIFEGVRNVLHDTLGVAPELITPEASLANELGADSLDLMDIVVHLNRRFSLKLSAKELARKLQDGHLNAMPGANGTEAQHNGNSTAGLGGGDHKTAELVTVSFLVDAVEDYIRGAAQTAVAAETTRSAGV